MRQVGDVAEAATMLRTIAREVVQTPDLLGRYISELLLVGDWKTSARLTEQVTDTDVRRQIEVQHVDAAVVHGDLDAAGLPQALRPALIRAVPWNNTPTAAKMSGLLAPCLPLPATLTKKGVIFSHR